MNFKSRTLKFTKRLFSKSIRWLRKLTLLILFFTTLLCSGQGDSNPLKFDQLTISNGLSHNTVYSILQDRFGYIWIGTQNGLNKYDGYNLTVYPSNGIEKIQDGFLGKQISALFEDSNGNLWVGTNRHGINYKSKDDDRFINLQSDSIFSSISGTEISSFFEDDEENLWITTIGSGILRFNLKSKAFKVFNQENSKLSSDVVFDIVKDKYGLIWVATAGGGLNNLVGDSSFEMSHEMLPNSPNMSGYQKKLLLDDEYLWIGTQGTGLYKMNLKDRSFIHFEKDNKERQVNSNAVMDLFKSKDGRLFIATDGNGLNVYDPATDDMVNYIHEPNSPTSLNSNSLRCLWGDRSGNIWMGTFNGGINIYKPNKTRFDYYAPGTNNGEATSGQSILAIQQDSDGDLLLGTDGGGLKWIKKNQNSKVSTFIHDPSDPSAISGNVVKAIYEDSRGQKWIGLFAGGLELFNPLNNSFEQLMSWRPNVWSIAERKNGQLLVATLGDGLYVVDINSKNLSRFRSTLITPGNELDLNLMTVFVDQSERIWLGTLDNGLILIDEAGSVYKHFKHNNANSSSISNNEIRCIFQDAEGEIWIGTEGGGINQWLGEDRFRRISEADGLIANSVMAISEDKNGRIWASTFQGISRIDRDKDIVNFDFRTFQNTNQFNQNAILTDQSGKLYFGGINGMHSISPEAVKEDTHLPELIFTDLKIFGKSIPVGKLPSGRIILDMPIEDSNDIWLNYSDQSFTLYFTAIDYTNSLDNEFSFMLEGFNQEWEKTPQGTPSVTYTNLDPGSYVFKVRHKDQLSSIQIHIKPPFWRTIWFRLLTILITLGILIYAMRFWIKRKEATANRKILQLKNENLATEVEAKNSKLMFFSAQMAHKNELLTELKEKLVSFGKNPKDNFRALIRQLDHELVNEDYWNEFNLYFNEVDKKFLDRIIKIHPGLTNNDLRLCSLLRMNLSTKEIASLLNITVRAVEQSRYRLKKRMKLSKEQELLTYMSSIA